MAGREFDVAVVGGGIAGASVAAELARGARVVLLEAEDRPGRHTTGRSAAVFAPSYGPAPIRALTRASEAFFHHPPEGFAASALVSPRRVLLIARADQRDALAVLAAELGPGPRHLAEGAVRATNPLIREGYAAEGLLDEAGRDIDVSALHEGYLRAFRSAGGTVLTGAGVTGLARSRGGWDVETAGGPLRAGIVVNAAGAWAEELGRLADAEPVGLVPKRRTAALVAPPAGARTAGLPLTVDVEERFYLKPDAGRLLISPADETPSAPCDAQPEEIDLAICVDRIEAAFALAVRRIEARWAGLRSFVADKSPVAGFSERMEGFYWLAGQGGYGIQSAPALSRLAAAQVMGRPVPSDIVDQGLNPADLAPGRAALRA